MIHAGEKVVWSPVNSSQCMFLCSNSHSPKTYPHNLYLNRNTETQISLALNYKWLLWIVLCTWGSCFTSAMGATTELIMSDRVCLASSGTIGSRPGLSCRPRMVAGWLLVPLPLKETFCSASLFSVLTAFSPYKKIHVIKDNNQGMSPRYLEMPSRLKYSGLMVSVLVSGLSRLGSSPVRDIVLCSWARHFILSAYLCPGI